MKGSRSKWGRLLLGFAGVLTLVMAVQIAESSTAPNNKCCIHAWETSSTSGGACYCNTSGVNSCEDLASDPCSAKAGWSGTHAGGCVTRTSQTCSTATVTLYEYSGSYYCGRYTILTCSTNSDCGCFFDYDNIFYTYRAVTVADCTGDECSL